MDSYLYKHKTIYQLMYLSNPRCKNLLVFLCFALTSKNTTDTKITSTTSCQIDKYLKDCRSKHKKNYAVKSINKSKESKNRSFSEHEQKDQKPRSGCKINYPKYKPAFKNTYKFNHSKTNNFKRNFQSSYTFHKNKMAYFAFKNRFNFAKNRTDKNFCRNLRFQSSIANDRNNERSTKETSKKRRDTNSLLQKDRKHQRKEIFKLEERILGVLENYDKLCRSKLDHRQNCTQRFYDSCGIFEYISSESILYAINRTSYFFVSWVN